MLIDPSRSLSRSLGNCLEGRTFRHDRLDRETVPVESDLSVKPIRCAKLRHRLRQERRRDVREGPSPGDARRTDGGGMANHWLVLRPNIAGTDHETSPDSRTRLTTIPARSRRAHAPLAPATTPSDLYTPTETASRFPGSGCRGLWSKRSALSHRDGEHVEEARGTRQAMALAHH